MNKNNIESTAILKESDSQDLPKYILTLSREWDLLSHRLTEVQRHLAILQQKSIKIQKKFNLHVHLSIIQAQQVTQLQVELVAELKQVREQQINPQSIQQYVKEVVDELDIDKNQQLENKIEQVVVRLNPTVEDFSSILDQRLKISFQKNKLYIDRAVYELKELLRKYVQEQAHMQRKIQTTSRQKSPHFRKNNLTTSSSTKKLLQVQSVKRSQIMSESGSVRESAIGSSRVNYLREKLKQFQKINKKYETPNEKPSQEAVEKMKNYKYFLQQSESELQPSNIMGMEEKAEQNHWRKNKNTKNMD